MHVGVPVPEVMPGSHSARAAGLKAGAGQDRTQDQVRPRAAAAKPWRSASRRDRGVGVGAGQPELPGGPAGGQRGPRRRRAAPTFPAVIVTVLDAGKRRADAAVARRGRRGPSHQPAAAGVAARQVARTAILARHRPMRCSSSAAGTMTATSRITRHPGRAKRMNGRAEPGQVPLGAVLPDIQLEAATRRACSSSKASGAGPRACPTCRMARSAAPATRPHPQRQDVAVAAPALAGVDLRCGAGQRRLGGVERGVDDPGGRRPVAVAAGQARSRSSAGPGRRRASRPPRRWRPRRSRAGSGTSPGTANGRRGGVEPDGLAGDRAQAAGDPGAGRVYRDHGCRRLTRNSWRSAGVGGDQRRIQGRPSEHQGLTPVSTTADGRRGPRGAAGLGGEDAPGAARRGGPASARMASASLCASRTRATVRLCSGGRQHGPAPVAVSAAAGRRQPPAVHRGQLQGRVDVLAGLLGRRR